MREVAWLLHRSSGILSARGKTSSLSEACRARPGRPGKPKSCFSVSHNATPPRVLCLDIGSSNGGSTSPVEWPAQRSTRLSDFEAGDGQESLGDILARQLGSNCREFQAN